MEIKQELTMEHVEKSFPLSSGGDALKILEDFSLSINKGEIIALVGPSGCGKSTLLNIVAGFEKPDRGQVKFMGKTVTGPSPQRGVVFQSAVLFPWLTVKENIAYGLRINKEKKETIDKKCDEFIRLVDLKGFENYYPDQLSGGMQQRVALARVLILKPKMLLMDEPFAALDAQTRIAMHQLLLSISEKISPTILFVTHDLDEALFLSDKIYVMSRLPGRIVREIKIPFGRPRSLSILGHFKFAKIKSETLKLLFNGVAP